jgi:hypothetical protein
VAEVLVVVVAVVLLAEVAVTEALETAAWAAEPLVELSREGMFRPTFARSALGVPFGT